MSRSGGMPTAESTLGLVQEGQITCRQCCVQENPNFRFEVQVKRMAKTPQMTKGIRNDSSIHALSFFSPPSSTVSTVPQCLFLGAQGVYSSANAPMTPAKIPPWTFIGTAPLVGAVVLCAEEVALVVRVEEVRLEAVDDAVLEVLPVLVEDVALLWLLDAEEADEADEAELELADAEDAEDADAELAEALEAEADDAEPVEVALRAVPVPVAPEMEKLLEKL